MTDLNDLILTEKLVNIQTGEIVGYIFEHPSNDGRRVALTYGRIKELGMTILNSLQYTEATVSDVVVYDNKYAYLREEIDENLKDIAPKLIGNKISYGGLMIEKFRFLDIDNETAIKRIMLNTLGDNYEDWIHKVKWGCNRANKR